MANIESESRNQADRTSQAPMHAGRNQPQSLTPRAGRRKRSWWRFLAGCLSVVTVTAADPGSGVVEAATKRAVVIGINEYQAKSELRALKYAASDATSMAKVLEKSGYRAEDIRVLTTGAASEQEQPTRTNIVAALKAAAQGEQVTSDDSLIVVFAGHGFNDRGESYLCPADFSGKAANDSALRVADIAYVLASSPAGEKYMVIDACRNDRNDETSREFNLLTGLKRMRLNDDQPPDRGESRQAKAEKRGKAESSRRAGRGIVFFSSCMAGQKSHEDPELDNRRGAGVFLHYLGEGLLGEADFASGNHDGRVTPWEAVSYAAEKTEHHVHVNFDSLQSPWTDSHATVNLTMVELPESVRKELAAKYADRLQDGLNHIERKQAEAKMEAALTSMVQGNNAATIKIISQAIEADGSYFMARRLRSVLYQIEGNNDPDMAYYNYTKAIDDMRAVGGSLRVTLTRPVHLQDRNHASISIVPAGTILLTEEATQFGGHNWVHVAGLMKETPEQGLTIEKPSQDCYVWLDVLADPAANAAQLDSYNRLQGVQTQRVNGGDGTRLDQVQTGLGITGAVLSQIPATSRAGGIINQVNGGLGLLRGF